MHQPEHDALSRACETQKKKRDHLEVKLIKRDLDPRNLSEHFILDSQNIGHTGKCGRDDASNVTRLLGSWMDH